MPFTKGQSGNPGGRPPKDRALTAILDDYGHKRRDTPVGRMAAGKRLAGLVWEGALTGRVDFGDRVVSLSGRGWSDLVPATRTSPYKLSSTFLAELRAFGIIKSTTPAFHVGSLLLFRPIPNL